MEKIRISPSRKQQKQNILKGCVLLLAVFLLCLPANAKRGFSPTPKGKSNYTYLPHFLRQFFGDTEERSSASLARKYIREGNALYRKNMRTDATVSYFKAVNADSTDARAQYNLATSMYPENWKMVQKEQQDTMVQTLLKAAELEQNPLRRSRAFHNIGTLFQNAKEFKMAIEAYKNALRNNPNDDESRYNLVLCQRQLKNEGADGDNSEQGQQDQQEDQQKQDEQQQQQQDQQQQEQQEPPMSKENAEQLLNAAMQEEKKTQEKMQQMQQGQRRKIEKNW